MQVRELHESLDNSKCPKTIAHFRLMVVNHFSQTEGIAFHYTALSLNTDMYSSNDPIYENESNIIWHSWKG